MSNAPRIVAVALLTEHELELLGQGFDRAFPIDDDNVFDDLVRAIDEAERAMQAQADGSHPGPKLTPER